MFVKIDNNQVVKYPYDSSKLRMEHPNVSFPAVITEDILAQYSIHIVAVESTPECDKATQKIVISEIPELINGVWTIKQTVVNKTEEEINEYLAKKVQDIAEKMEQGIENHINETVKSRGYNSQDSIAKYLVSGNPFYDECTAISLWIGSVWVYSHQVQADVMAGTRTMPTIEELIAELPALVI